MLCHTRAIAPLFAPPPPPSAPPCTDHQIGVACVVLDEAAAEDDHARALGKDGGVVDPTDVCSVDAVVPSVPHGERAQTHPSGRRRRAHTFDEVEHEAWLAVRVKVHHVAEGAVRQRGAEDGDVILSSPGTKKNAALGCQGGPRSATVRANILPVTPWRPSSRSSQGG